MQPILVSSCLLGIATRYDGTDNWNQEVVDYLKNNKLIPIPVCPEQLAGLPTPRPKCWFSQGDGSAVIEKNGQLVTETGREISATFRHGASETLKIAKLSGCTRAILQQRSPSCGTDTVYLNETLVAGEGVTTALLRKNGFTVFGSDNLPAENN